MKVSKKSSWLTTENAVSFAIVAAVALAPAMGFAADATTGSEFASKTGGACEFVRNIHTVLNLISVAVVTIAIIFAGYQIAFAHKRIADVAPILIGGVLIGAAGQIAKMLVTTTQSCDTASAIQIMQHFV